MSQKPPTAPATTPATVPRMTLQERALYHQIHPLKLATDILATPPAIALF